MSTPQPPSLLKTPLYSLTGTIHPHWAVHSFPVGVLMVGTHQDGVGWVASFSRKSLKTLQLVQNAAARVLTRTKKREHITPVLASLHWLPVKSRIEFKILLLTFKALNNMAPLYLKELVVPYQPTRALCSQNSSLLVVPTVSKSRVGARAFSYQAPHLWNHLPLSVREADTICTFKSRLKTFLFDKAYS